MLIEDVSVGLALTVIVAVIAVTFEQLAPLERVSWRKRAIGALFALTMLFSFATVTFALGRLWQALGVPMLLPPLEAWAGWAAVPLTLVLADFLKYWEHRFEHRFLWRVHCVHHAPSDLHAMNNYGHPLHSFPAFFLVILPLSLLNFHSFTTPLAVSIVASLLNAISHSPVAFHFGPLRRVIIDNRFHRIHHSLESRHFEKNFGVLFSVWDTLFSTAYFPKPGEWPKVGVAGLNQPLSLFRFLAIPFERAEPTLPSGPVRLQR